jgi:hypothetical protein
MVNSSGLLELLAAEFSGFDAELWQAASAMIAETAANADHRRQ